MNKQWIVHAEAMRYPAGLEMSPHDHQDSSLCLTVAGGYTETICGRSTDHRSGHVLFYPALESHSQCFSGQGALKILLQPGEAGLSYLDAHVGPKQAPYVYSNEFVSIGARLCTELGQPDSFSKLVVEGLLLEILGCFCRGCDRFPTSKKLQSVCEIITAQEGLVIDSARIAQQVGEEPVKLTLAFRRAYGETIGQYARSARLAAAAQKLATTREPIAAIAIDSGYYDQAHFTRAFRKRFGLTPARYRRAAN